MINDKQLLQQYAQERSESAFGELVARHLDYVYSDALRVVNGDAPLAQDVTQTVFFDLARQAGKLSCDVALAGWLHRHTCYTAAKAVRTERRRQSREHTAMEMRALDDNTRPEWELVAPYLDESLNELDPKDRDALVLRYLRKQNLRAVGATLGISEDAAQKRVDRALEKLHILLKHRGATLSVGTLGIVLATQAVTAAPEGFAGSVIATALASAAAGGGMTATLVKLMTMTKVKLGIIGVIAVAGVATPLVIQQRTLIGLREESGSLQQQVDQLAEQRAENERLSNLIAQASTTRGQTSNQLSELLKLRGEVGLLRAQSSELAKQRDENGKLRAGLAGKQPAAEDRPSSNAYIPRESWAFAGYDTPENALQSVWWAVNKGDSQTFLASITPDMLERVQQPGVAGVSLVGALAEETAKIKGYQIMKATDVAEDQVLLDVSFDGEVRKVKLAKTQGQWRLAEPMLR